MERMALRNDQWEGIKDFLSSKSTDCGATATDNRKFIEAVLWIARTGAPWRNLPEKFSYWYRVYVCYNRWFEKDVWDRIFAALSAAPDLENLSAWRATKNGASAISSR